MSYDVHQMYPQEYHAGGADPALRESWDWIAEALTSTLPESLKDWCDVGCGPGGLVEALRRRGKNSWGIEGSKHALGHITVPIMIWDLRLPLRLGPLVDVVTCFDVAEHVGAAETLVETISGLAKHRILFGAAPPGQDGHGHIDLRPPEEWIQMFHRRGWNLCQNTTTQLKSLIESREIHNKLWWVEKNLLAFSSV